MHGSQKQALIVGMARTPIAREGGALKDVTAEDLAALVIGEAVKRSGLSDPQTIDEVIFGNLMSEVHCMSRYALLRAGLPMSVPAITIDRQCGSGSTAVNLASALIKGGAGDVYVAGGAESMTREAYMLERPCSSYQRVAPRFIQPRPVAPEEIGDLPMGIIAENMAERWGVSRESQDEFAYLSQMKAARALGEGRFAEQIVPVAVPQKKGEPVVFDTDEHPRPNTTLDGLARLRPAFKPNGTVTAGSSSGINDAAAALVLTSRDTSERLGLRPLAVVTDFAQAGVDPRLMGIGPVPATMKLLARTGVSVQDLDVIELNEAFASQAIACCEELGIDWQGCHRDKLNPNGGAIALGHPVGASLAILVIKAVAELHRTRGRYALVTACCGGGQGVATLIERWDGGDTRGN